MEILYSKAILSFLKKIKGFAKEIIIEEMGLAAYHSRFAVGKLIYPLHFVVFDHPSKLGYFQGNLYEIGINKIFLLEKETEIKNLLRHELAHYMTYIEHGSNVPSHGKEFKEICKRYGWSPEVSMGRVSIDEGVKNRKVAQKVRKLLSLTHSPNPEEAHAATLKAKELLEKYQISLDEEGEEKVAVRVLEKKRCDAKLQAIASILRSFHVYPIFNRGQGIVYLELFGEQVSIEIAEYVAYFLDKQFERLWEEVKKENPQLKGAVAKNSFFRGLAKGYEKKMPLSTSKGIIKIEKELITSAQNAYPHLHNLKSTYSNHEKALCIGKEKGKFLHIQESIAKKYQKILR